MSKGEGGEGWSFVRSARPQAHGTAFAASSAGPQALRCAALNLPSTPSCCARCAAQPSVLPTPNVFHPSPLLCAPYSYIFSQTLFNMRMGVDSPLMGCIIIGALRRAAASVALGRCECCAGAGRGQLSKKGRLPEARPGGHGGCLFPRGCAYLMAMLPPFLQEPGGQPH